MSRAARRSYPDSVRLDLLEEDADRSDARFDALEETSGANRTAFWTGLVTIVVALLTVVGSILGVVLT